MEAESTFWTTYASIFIALLAVILGPLGVIYNSDRSLKKQTRVANLEKWMIDFRKQISRYISAVVITQDDIENKRDYIAHLTEVNDAYCNIMLLLNPTPDKENSLKIQKQMDLVDEFLSKEFRDEEISSGIELRPYYTEIIKLSRDVLLSKWKKIKECKV